ncbi:hypothetical protein SLEP1_g27731 [Rubroshorea leprosula]|uniref:Uncharacterized protein n=1 Tax=Rubroshorea leprosula TaxID=152421 RepID=A0AAV5JYE9_9ROSI|nr:hypothetical protein SLEP1_g27731 [Rubroshorea leprosula]
MLVGRTEGGATQTREELFCTLEEKPSSRPAFSPSASVVHQQQKKTQNRTNLLCELRTQEPIPFAEEPRCRPAFLGDPDHSTPFGKLQFFIVWVLLFLNFLL